MYAFGTFRIVVECDLGPLGIQQGREIRFYWSPLYHVLKLVVWVPLILAFVLLKENRRPAVLWILLPVLVCWGGYEGLARMTSMTGEAQSFLDIILACVMVSFCLVWLLGERIRCRFRVVTVLWALLIFGVMTVLGMLSVWGNWKYDETLILVTAPIMMAFVVLTLAVTLAGILNRKRLSAVRFALGLIPGCIIGTMIPLSLLWLKIMSNFDQLFMMLGIMLMTSGVFYGMLLPFVVLFFVNDFWRQRFAAVTGLRPAKARCADVQDA
jgi:hypothetical protein